jgi:hypothetical protein
MSEQIKLECLKIAASFGGNPDAIKRIYLELIELLALDQKGIV